MGDRGRNCDYEVNQPYVTYYFLQKDMKLQIFPTCAIQEQASLKKGELYISRLKQLMLIYFNKLSLLYNFNQFINLSVSPACNRKYCLYFSTRLLLMVKTKNSLLSKHQNSKKYDKNTSTNLPQINYQYKINRFQTLLHQFTSQHFHIDLYQQQQMKYNYQNYIQFIIYKQHHLRILQSTTKIFNKNLYQIFVQLLILKKSANCTQYYISICHEQFFMYRTCPLIQVQSLLLFFCTRILFLEFDNYNNHQPDNNHNH
eukprot:TRINITY_DN41460_c0_g1_i3.p1 TRINITY_DN41460_c0_g1~~TRINITY_DN41460_c0_g1_i3.p1  ORF type:complete len:270 (-),score=-20.26 TRINITY_DN41460_c0_g1_i3:94-864(-)